MKRTSFLSLSFLIGTTLACAALTAMPALGQSSLGQSFTGQSQDTPKGNPPKDNQPQDNQKDLPVPAAETQHYSVQGQAAGVPVSYASVTELNGILSQIEAASKDTQADLVKLRVERWKTDIAYKKQALTNVDSIQRNLQGALPEIMKQLRATPEDVPATFKLYRNLDALYDVLGSVVESAGAFGSKDDFQALSNDLNNFEGARKQFAGRIENLSSSKEAEIVRLRAELKTAQAAIPAPPPKKLIVDDTEAPKKPPVKKKPTPKITPVKPAAGQPQPQTPPAQPSTPKPQ
jgi:hypothetical protein